MDNTSIFSIHARRITSSAVMGTEKLEPSPRSLSRGRQRARRGTHIGVILTIDKATILDYGKCSQMICDSRFTEYIVWIHLPAFQGVVDPNNCTNFRNEETQRIASTLSVLGLREDEQPSAISKVIELLDTAVTPVMPVHLKIRDLTLIEQNATPDRIENLRFSGPKSSCAICLEDYADEETIISRWPCGHLYHKDCSNKWLKISHLCPLCRCDSR